jgi:hypothetical protein
VPIVQVAIAKLQIALLIGSDRFAARDPRTLCFGLCNKSILTGIGFAVASQLSLSLSRGHKMDLVIWLPALAILGLAGLGLMFAFLKACERV